MIPMGSSHPRWCFSDFATPSTAGFFGEKSWTFLETSISCLLNMNKPKERSANKVYCEHLENLDYWTWGRKMSKLTTTCSWSGLWGLTCFSSLHSNRLHLMGIGEIIYKWVMFHSYVKNYQMDNQSIMCDGSIIYHLKLIIVFNSSLFAYTCINDLRYTQCP